MASACRTPRPVATPGRRAPRRPRARGSGRRASRVVRPSARGAARGAWLTAQLVRRRGVRRAGRIAAAERAPRMSLLAIAADSESRVRPEDVEFTMHADAAAPLAGPFGVWHEAVRADAQRIRRLDRLDRSVSRVRHVTVYA